MQWLKRVVDEVEKTHPDGEIVVSSGVSPSGKYHVGTLREVLTADAILIELKRRGRQARHIHVVDDLDVLRKIPAGITEEFSKYLGRPLCDVPSPEGQGSYADYYFEDFHKNMGALGIDAEVMRSYKKYREGFFAPAIENALSKIEEARKSLETISGRKLGDEWSPVQVNEGGYLKKRKFLGIDTAAKTIDYEDLEGKKQSISYDQGDVKLDWRIDWPARWWLLGVDAEPFGRDHATKGGSYDTGADLVKKIFGAEPPIPISYQFINRAGETKKMSKSAGNTVTISELLQILPPEIVRFFVLRYPPEKTLFFDQTEGVVRLIDEYAELLTKPSKTVEDELTLAISSSVVKENTISNVPFSHLVASYQAARRDPDRTLKVLERTGFDTQVKQQAETIKKELAYIQNWLDKWAGEDVKFSIEENPDFSPISAEEKEILAKIAGQIKDPPANADGAWFHAAIYRVKEENNLTPQQVFQPFYKVIINKDHGPRAGYFLADLAADSGIDWLIKRLKLET